MVFIYGGELGKYLLSDEGRARGAKSVGKRARGGGCGGDHTINL